MSERRLTSAPYSDPRAELLYGRSIDARVFVASQMRDPTGGKVYEVERSALADAIDGIPRMTPWLWERDSPIGDYSSEEICVRVAGTSDCLVLVLGAELTPTTRKEFQAARAAQAHCFIFQDSRIEPNEEVSEFVSLAREEAVTGRFESSDELARAAVDHLTRRAVFSLRQSILARRDSGASETVPIEDRESAWSEAPATRKYEAQEVQFVESVDGKGEGESVAEIVERERKNARDGREGDAFAELASTAFALWELGRADLALEVIDELHLIVPSGRMSPAEDAWLMNTEALALARVGRTSDARKKWKRMLAIGDRMSDSRLRAVAMQNLAVDAINANDTANARDLMKQSFELMRELEDVRSMLQLLNSQILISIDEDELDAAEEQLDLYEASARESGDTRLLISASGNRGRLNVARGNFTEAESNYKESLKLSRSVNDVVGQLQSFQNLGAVCADQDRYGDAMRWYRKGIGLAETYEFQVFLEVLRRSLATVLHRRGRNREAIEEFDRSRAVAWGLGSQHRWAETTANMGAVYVLVGAHASAIGPLEKAASMFRELGDLDSEVKALKNLAAAERGRGEPGLGIERLQRALAIVPAAAHEDRSELLRDAADIALEDPELVDDAIRLFEDALEEEAKFLDVTELGTRSIGVGTFIGQAIGAARALPFFDKAIELLEEEPYGSFTLADALNDRAIQLADADRFDEAKIDLDRCLQLARGEEDKPLRQRALANLSEVERQRRDMEAAVIAARRARELALEMGDKAAIVHALGNLGLALEDENEQDEADRAMRGLLSLAEAEGVSEWKAKAYSGLARVSFIRGSFDDAARWYRLAVDETQGVGPDSGTFELGGLLESLAKANATEELESVAQALIDRVAAGESPELIIEFMTRAGTSCLAAGALDEGRSLLGGALLVGLSAPGLEVASDEAEAFRPLGEALGLLVIAARGDHHFDETLVYSQVIEFLETHSAGAGNSVEPLLEMMIEVMDEDSDE